MLAGGNAGAGEAAAEGGGPEEIPVLLPGPHEGQRETVQARALLEKAERLLERVQEEDRPEVQRLMDRVRTALTDRQWTQLAATTVIGATGNYPLGSIFGNGL